MSFKLALTVTALAVILGIGWAVTGQAPEAVVQEKVKHVDEQIAALTADTAYQDGTLEERRDLAQAALTQLEKEGYLTQLNYDGEQDLFSFQYADGSLGGVYLADFSSSGGGLPMN